MIAARRTRARVEHRHAVGAKEHDDPAAVPAQIVDALNQRVHRDLVLVVAVLLRARRGQANRLRR